MNQTTSQTVKKNRAIRCETITYKSLLVLDGKMLILVQREETSAWISSRSYFVGTTLTCNNARQLLIYCCRAFWITKARRLNYDVIWTQLQFVFLCKIWLLLRKIGGKWYIQSRKLIEKSCTVVWGKIASFLLSLSTVKCLSFIKNVLWVTNENTAR